MKRALLLVAVLTFTTCNMFAQKDYTREWRQTDSLMQIGQVQGAQAIVDKLYDESRTQNNVPQFVKACLYRISLKNSYEEEATVKMINELEVTITTTTAPAKNLLHSIIAEMYWKYYQQNRWKFANRTATEVVPDDVRTWDLRRIVAACEAHYSASLENAPELQKSNIGIYNAILERRKESEKYRPTLFDFLAFRAVEFYSSNDAGLVQPAAPFKVTNAAYFTSAADFSTLTITSPDTLSFDYYALVNLQKVIAFHLTDSDPTALLDADLQRLDFVYNKTTLPEKDSLYLAALQALDSKYANHPSSTEILFRIAKLYKQQGEAYDPFKNTAAQWKKKEAIAVIEKAVARFPDSFGAVNGKALRNELEQPLLTLTTDKAVLPNKPVLASLQYRNVKTVYFRIVSLDFKQTLKTDDTKYKPATFYAKLKPLKTWSVDLPDDGDYQTHTIELALPGLKEGYYAILTSTDEKFSEESTLWNENKLWVTNLSYVPQNNYGGNVQVMVLHRESGQPLRNVQVQTYTRDYNYDKRRYTVRYGDTLITNNEGIVTLKGTSDYRSVGLLLTHGKDSYSNSDYIYLYRYNEPRNQIYYSTTFFTDRAIYRPGQTVYFKGIVLQQDTNNPEKTDIVKNYTQIVTFYNTNNEKVSEMKVTTNEFGSFAGNFTAPATGLTGMMNIRANNANGYISFRVEEYKRPKFEITFNPVEGNYRLNEKITVTGNAKSYAGSAVSEAKATYRVMRQARYPYWRWWWGPMPSSPAQEIVNGESVTKADGSFDIEFTAIPDGSIAKKEAPVFYYTVHATVVDINGETHEAQTSVPVGYQSLLISTDVPEKINLDEWKTVTVTATNLNGTPQSTKGALTIWKLRAPGRLLQDRQWARPDKFSMPRAEFEKLFPYSVYDNEDNASTWEKEKQVYHLSFDTGDTTKYSIPDTKKWTSGNYLIEVKTQDTSGEAVENTMICTAFASAQKTVPANEIAWFEVLTPTVQPGDVAKIAIGSAAKNVPVVFETLEENKVAKRQIISLNGEQKIFEIPVVEKDRGNFGVNMFFVKGNRVYSANQTIQVPYENKKLNIEFATFRDKLQPGQHEEWRITIKDKKGDAVAAELLASMYDASLDVFTPHAWNFFPWRTKYVQSSWNVNATFRNAQSIGLASNYSWLSITERAYDRLLVPYILNLYYGGYRYYANDMEEMKMSEVSSQSYDSRVADAIEGRMAGVQVAMAKPAPAPATMAAKASGINDNEMGDVVNTDEKTPTESTQPVQIRKNFNETAFFYPQLKTTENGETVVSFTVPEALTRWKMQGLAWTQDLKVGAVTKELVTQKELMIFTNVPRFFRENDTIYFSAKLSNISDKALNVKTTVQFFDAFTMQPVSEKLLLEKETQETPLAAGENKAMAWKLYIPEGLQAITYRITAASQSFSDGEENTIPVLTNRMLVTESLPLPIRGNQTKSYEFTKLLHHESNTLKNYSYTIEFTSHPAWNAVQALPYIMEYPYECAEQAFSRYYANSIATHIVNSDPKIKQVFEIWRNYQPGALQSNLEKNEELKMLLLEETPWVRAAQNESERKQRIAVLFDLNRMSNELASALRKVEQAQTPNGGFAWFRGGRDDRYITQHIVAGIGHLKKMNVQTKATGNMLRNAVNYMDARLAEDFSELKKQAEKNKKEYKKEDHLSYLAIHYLYARSFFAKDFAIAPASKEAFDFYQSQAVTYWTKNNNYLKGMLALALNRYGDTKTAKLIMKSLTETALHSDEMGMYWRSESRGWWWYQAPVETQALMIEAYNEILNDQKVVDDLKVWLLKEKQTTDWKTTKATAEAVYALLAPTPQEGLPSLLSSDKLCEITVGGKTLDPYNDDRATSPSGAGGAFPEAGTGYFKTSWKGGDIKSDMGKITVKNPNPTVAWGAAYWQYFEQLDKITPATTGVKITKQLFVKTNSPTGPVLKEIKPDASIKVGDKVTVRIEIRTDRDMEYVHLKDMRAAAFEPVNVLSGYKWQGGLGYYESTRDAATNFFISYLPKGTYVFEYDLFATQQGEFSNGITSLQCMYAPEFTTHNEGIRVKVVE